jgi:hypothetical protein
MLTNSGLLVTGIISPTGEVGFAPTFLAPDGAMVLGPTSSPLSITVQTQGGERWTLPALVSLAPGLIFFAATLPEGVEPVRVGLVFRNQEVGTDIASPHKPWVRIIWPNGGEILRGTGPHTLRWEAGDEDGDELGFVVETSADGGVTWQPLGATVGQTELTVAAETGSLDPSLNALIRVTVSDGLNVALDQSDGRFTVNPSQIYVPILY